MTDDIIEPPDPDEDLDDDDASLLEHENAEPVLGDESEDDDAPGEDVKTSEVPADAF